MRQDGRGAVCAAHPSFPVIAVGTGAGLGFFDQSLRLLQRLELQVRDLAWHPQSLALAVLEGQQVRIFASDRPGVAFRCHTLTLPWPAAAVCFAPAQLLLGGRELCNWPCRVYGLHVSSAAEGELWPLPEPVSELQLDNSGRFIASLHVGATLRVWWADEEGDAGTGRRRRGSSGSIMDCRSEVIQRDCMAARWAPAKRRGGCPSLLAALGRDGSVTVWRESAFDELPCFVAEARWTDACYTAFGWVVPADGDEEFQDAEDKVPRPTNHGVQASGRMGSTLSLVALGEDQDAVLLKLGTGSRRKVGRLDVLPQTLCSSQGSSCGGVLSVREGSALDLWVCSQSGDLQRWRLGDAKVFVAAAGGAVPLSLILEDMRQQVIAMAVNSDWGYVAVLLENPEGSAVWIAEMPQSRAQLVSGRYAVAEGDALFHEKALGTLRCSRLVALCWVGDAKLLAVTETGSLLWASVDSVRGLDAWNQALWKTDAEYDVSVNAVQQLQAVSEADNLVGLMVDEIDGLYCILARVEVTSSALSLQRVFSHRCAGRGPVCFATEWLGWAEGEVAGQLALWSPPQIAVMTLESADSTVTVRQTLMVPLRGDAVLQMALCDECLVALTTREVLVWLLEGEHAPLRHCQLLATRQQGAEKDSATSHYLGGPVSQSGRAVAYNSADADAHFTEGSLSLLRCAGGALLLLVAACSAEVVAPASALLCRGSIDRWEAVDLRAEALPLEPAACAWCGDGAVLHVGLCGSPAGPRRPVLVVTALPARGYLQAASPCPAYHPETLIWLLRRGQVALARRILQQLLQVLRSSRPFGIPPLVDMDFAEFHCGDAFVEDTAPPALPEPGSEVSQTADALFGEDDLEARLAQLSRGWMEEEEEEEESPNNSEAPQAQDQSGWQLPESDVQELARYLQTTALPMVSSHEQAQLLVLVQDIGAAPHASDLDESGRRFTKAFEIHAAVRRWQLKTPNSENLLQRLNSEDLCWALHSDCQGTIVDIILEALGTDLDWPALRHVGLGLWLTDLAALKKVLEQLPRVLLRRQGQDLQPETVALWYALLGRRSLLAQLYRQGKQTRVADFLSNDLSDEWRAKAEKNAFELVRQRRFELACAFFVFAERARDAIDVCVRYMDDWPLAVLIAQHIRADRSDAAEEVTSELRRVLRADLLPIAQRAHDPWLGSLVHWHLGEHHEAVLSVARPFHDLMDEDEKPGTSQFFSASALQHCSFSPGLPRFLSLLQAVLAKRNEVITQDGAQQVGSLAVIARAYLARRQPLLALPPEAEVLPWRTAVAVARSLTSLYCISGQNQLSPDGQFLLVPLSEVIRRRLGLASLCPMLLREVHKQAAREAALGADFWEVCTDVEEFYAPSRRWLACRLPKTREAVMEMTGPSALWLLPCLSNTLEGEDAGLCRRLRLLAGPYATRALVTDTTPAVLAAVAWCVLPRLRTYMEEPSGAFPLALMHLVIHIVCAACISRPPPCLNAAQAANTEFSGDMFHVVTTLALVLVVLLSLRGLTANTRLWPDQDEEDYRAVLLEAQIRDPSSEDGGRVTDWEPLLWQGLRVLLEQLKGTSDEQRRLLRCGAIPSMVATLFLDRSSPEAAEAAARGDTARRPAPLSPSSSGSEGEDGKRSRHGCRAALANLAAAAENPGIASSLRNLLGCSVAELTLERLVLLLAGIRRRPAHSSGHWIAAWYDALLDSLRQLLRYARSRLLEAATEVSDVFDRWPQALCAPEAQLSSTLANVIGESRDAFLSLWQQLNGTRRLVLLFAHHPRLLTPSSRLTRRRAVLWKGNAGLRFVCADHGFGALQIIFHAKGTMWPLHAGHAARWAANATATPEAEAKQRVEAYAMAALTASSSARIGEAEFLLGGASRDADPGDETSVSDRGPEVAHFLATLRLPAEARSQARTSTAGLVSAASHPSKSLFAAATEDGTIQLWSFNQRLLRQLPRPVSKRRQRPGGVAGDEPASEAATSGAWRLAWNTPGNRLLAVQSGGKTSVNLWALEGDQPGVAYTLCTGAAHARLHCASFASYSGAVVATGGRRAEVEFTAPGLPTTTMKAWPHVAAGICVWDSLSPASSSLVAHDGIEASSTMPPDYCSMAWAASQQRIFCGTKAGELRIFDLRMARMAQRFEAHGEAVRHCFVLEETGQLATLSDAAELKLWNLRNLELLDTVPALHSPVRGVGSVLGGKALSCASLLAQRHLLTGGQDGSLVLTRL